MLNPRPSSAHQWVPCPGSLKLQKKFPELESDRTAAEEGEASHWYAMYHLKFNEPPPRNTDANGTVLTDEMREGAMIYVDAVRAELAGMADGYAEYEKQMPITLLGGIKGTPDSYTFDRTTKTLVIWDYKYGHGVVEVARNWQLFCYASELKRILDVKHTEFVIVQPRGFHPDGIIRRWTLTDDVYEEMRHQLTVALDWTRAENPRTKAGPHCKYCSARHACTTLQQSASDDPMALIGSSRSNLMDPARLGAALRILKNIDSQVSALKSGLEAQAEQMLKKGAVIPGWCLAPSQGKLVWNVDAETVEDVGKSMKQDWLKPKAAITPTQAIAAGGQEAHIKAMSTRKNSMVLKEDDVQNLTNIFPIN